jgi:DNA/RNA endonuclease YhcR with UshA esterase domain
MNPKHFGVLLVVSTVITCVAPTSFCQGMQYRAGGRMYIPNSEITVNRTVEEVRTMTGRRGFGGTHLDLKTDSGVFDAHLGPSSYLASKGFMFAKGDQIEVAGSKQTFHGHDAIIRVG